jgi:hypothetical protein
MMKEILSFYTRTRKNIILACMALHIFVCDNNLHDWEFDRYEADEEYLVDPSNSTIQMKRMRIPQISFIVG